jgi:hypothetical protein
MPNPINISASRGAAVLGLSEYQTKIDIWLQMMESREPGFCAARNYIVPEFEYNSAMKWGHAFESAVIMLAEEKTESRITHREDFHEAYQRPYMTCHIDGVYKGLSKPGATVLHEGKTTSLQYFYSAFGEPGTDRIPMGYQIQCQHQMICTGAQKVILSVLVFPKRVEEWEKEGWVPEKVDPLYFHNNDYVLYNGEKRVGARDWAKSLSEMGYFHQYEILPNIELQKLMIEKYEIFWNENILKGIMPDPVSCADIKKIYTEPKGTVIADEIIERFAHEKKQLSEEIKEMRRKEDQLKFLIQDYMRISDKTVDDETREKTFLLDRTGKKLASYSKTGGMR